jgi:hypothetical protein
MRGSLKSALPVLAMALSVLAMFAAGCDGDEGVVGGDCAPGYGRCGPQRCCALVDGSLLSDSAVPPDAGDANTQDSTDIGEERGPEGDGSGSDAPGNDGSAPPDGSLGDGAAEAEGGVTCTPPLVACFGQCVDTTSDPSNCSFCGNVCPSQICQSSTCIGSTAGGIVFIGHDYATTPPGTSQARVLSNAVFLAQSEPLNALSYERYALPAATARVKTILAGVATQLGRQFTLTSTSTDADIPNDLTPANYGVLIVHDQASAPAGAMAVLGASWQATLTAFTRQSGIVVVLDGGTGIGEMPAFATATTLLDVSAQASVPTGTFLDVIAPGDAVGVAVISPYGAGSSTVSLTTEPNGGGVVYVVVLPEDGGAAAPVVVHKAL